MGYRKVWEHDNAEYRAEAIARLRKLFPVGSEVTTTVKHVAASGMSRVIKVIGYDAERGRIVDVSMDVARVLNDRYDDSRGGVFVPGCGMDMCFATTYSLARVLYGHLDAETIAASTTNGGSRDAGYLLTNHNI